jgi:autotransporter-associated beta strand protein/T5SS/PEP-CTERM-associated repeat protein
MHSVDPRRRATPPPRRPIRLAWLALLLLAAPADAQSTWSNPAGGNWNVAGNWGGTAPVSSATTALIFGAVATQNASYTATNNIADPFDLNALTFNNTAGTVTLAGTALNFTGTNPTITQSGAGAAVVTTPITLTSATTIAGTGTGPLTLGGALSGGANDLIKTSAGPLTLGGGGTLNQLSLRAGATTISGGTLALTNPNNADNSSSGIQLGSDTGQTASLTLSGGATVNVTENVYVGDVAGSTGTLTVTGAGTVLNALGGASNRFGVGNSGTGTLNVTNGGVVNVLRLFTPRNAGSSSTILIDGAGSELHVVTQSAIASNGAGNFTVQNGGRFRSEPSITMGQNAPGSGTLTVTGAGSLVSTTNAGSDFIMGNVAGGAGPFTLNVNNGGAVTIIDQFAVVRGASTVTIDSGGRVSNGGAGFVGGLEGTSIVNVTGTNSALVIGTNLAVGGNNSAGGGTPSTGTGVLNIAAGGTVTVPGLIAIYAPGTVNLNAGGSLNAGGLVNGAATSIGAVNLAAGTTLNLANATGTFGGVIGGAGALVKNGTGVQTLAGANTYSGGTTISAGPLLVTNTTGSGTGTGPVTVNGSGVLGGTGTVSGAVTVGGGGAVAPGIAGTLTPLNVGAMTWQGGGRYDFEFSDATTGDLVNGTGALNLAALSATNRFTINIVSTDPALTTPQTYTIATFAGGVTGFDAAAGSPQFSFGGFFAPGSASLALAGNSLRLTFTPVPEPAHILLLCAAAAGAMRLRRWRRAR